MKGRAKIIATALVVAGLAAAVVLGATSGQRRRCQRNADPPQTRPQPCRRIAAR